MAFRDLFPWTHGMWSVASSKPARIFLLISALLLVATMAAFRVESYLFESRVHSVLSRMALINLDNTSEQELRFLLPEFEGPDGPECQDGTVSGKIYGIRISDVDRGVLSKLIEGLGQYNRPALTSLYFLCHRFHRFGASAAICAGKVVSVGYFVWIDDDRWHNMFAGTAVAVRGYSGTGWFYSRNYSDGWSYEKVVPYVERVASNAPENDLTITYTAKAPADFIRSTFNLRLVCLQSLAGCISTRQLLPAVWPPQFAWRRQGFSR